MAHSAVRSTKRMAKLIIASRRVDSQHIAVHTYTHSSLHLPSTTPFFPERSRRTSSQRVAVRRVVPVLCPITGCTFRIVRIDMAD